MSPRLHFYSLIISAMNDRYEIQGVALGLVLPAMSFSVLQIQMVSKFS